MNTKAFQDGLVKLRELSQGVTDHVKGQIAESDLIAVAVDAIANSKPEELQAAMEELFLQNNTDFEHFYDHALIMAESYAKAEVQKFAGRSNS